MKDRLDLIIGLLFAIAAMLITNSFLAITIGLISMLYSGTVLYRNVFRRTK